MPLPRSQRMVGLRPPKNAAAIMLGPALTGAVPAHPPAVDNLPKVTDWGLYGNNKYGDCGPVSVANNRKLVSAYLAGAEDSVTLDDVFDLYRRSGNPGFDPADPGGPGDAGVDMQTMLDALAAGGIGGRYPVCFAKVDHNNPDEIHAAVAIFGGILLGVVLEDAQQAQTDQGGPWDYAPSGQWGGHAVLAGRYSAPAARTGLVTWAEVLDATDAFLTHQLQEAWVIVWPEHLSHPGFCEGVNRAAFEAQYTALTGRPFPNPAPGPGPAPVPGPDPVDPQAALAGFFATVGPWALLTHHGATARIAKAIRDLRAELGM